MYQTSKKNLYTYSKNIRTNVTNGSQIRRSTWNWRIICLFHQRNLNRTKNSVHAIANPLKRMHADRIMDASITNHALSVPRIARPQEVVEIKDLHNVSTRESSWSSSTSKDGVWPRWKTSHKGNSLSNTWGKWSIVLSLTDVFNICWRLNRKICTTLNWKRIYTSMLARVATSRVLSTIHASRIVLQKNGSSKDEQESDCLQLLISRRWILFWYPQLKCSFHFTSYNSSAFFFLFNRIPSWPLTITGIRLKA